VNSFVIRKGDRLPAITATLTDSAGAAVNLTGGTVKLTMTEIGATTPKVDNAAVTVVSATAGTVSYSWAAADTNSTGLYFAEFEFTNASSLERTFPNPDHIMVHVTPSLG
jgi:hypothetical protein